MLMQKQGTTGDGTMTELCSIHEPPQYNFLNHLKECPICTGEQATVPARYLPKERNRPMSYSAAGFEPKPAGYKEDFFICPKHAWFTRYSFCVETRVPRWNECKSCKEYDKHPPRMPTRFKRKPKIAEPKVAEPKVKRTRKPAAKPAEQAGFFSDNQIKPKRKRRRN